MQLTKDKKGIPNKSPKSQNQVKNVLVKNPSFGQNEVTFSQNQNVENEQNQDDKKQQKEQNINEEVKQGEKIFTINDQQQEQQNQNNVSPTFERKKWENSSNNSRRNSLKQNMLFDNSKDKNDLLKQNIEKKYKSKDVKAVNKANVNRQTPLTNFYRKERPNSSKILKELQQQYKQQHQQKTGQIQQNSNSNSNNQDIDNQNNKNSFQQHFQNKKVGNMKNNVEQLKRPRRNSTKFQTGQKGNQSRSGQPQNTKSCQNIEEHENSSTSNNNSNIKNEKFSDYVNQNNENQVFMESEFFGNREIGGFKSINIFDDSYNEQENKENQGKFEKNNDQLRQLYNIDSEKNEFIDSFQDSKNQIKSLQKLESSSEKSGKTYLLENLDNGKLLQDYCNYLDNYIQSQIKDAKISKNENLKANTNTNKNKQFPEYQVKNKNKKDEQILNQQNFQEILQSISGFQNMQQNIQENINQMDIFQILSQIQSESQSQIGQIQNFSFKNVFKSTLQFFVKKIEDIQCQIQNIEIKQKQEIKPEFETIQSNESENKIQMSQQKFQQIYDIIEQQYMNNMSDQQLLLNSSNKNQKNKSYMEKLDFFMKEIQKSFRKQQYQQFQQSPSQNQNQNKNNNMRNINNFSSNYFEDFNMDNSRKSNEKVGRNSFHNQQYQLSNTIKQDGINYYNIKSMEKEEIEKAEANIKKIINSGGSLRSINFKSSYQDISPFNKNSLQQNKNTNLQKNLVNNGINNNNQKAYKYNRGNVFSETVLDNQNDENAIKGKDIGAFTFYNSKKKQNQRIEKEKDENFSSKVNNDNSQNRQFREFRNSNSFNTNNSNIKTIDSSVKNNNSLQNYENRQNNNLSMVNDRKNNSNTIDNDQQNLYHQQVKLKSIPNLSSPVHLKKINYNNAPQRNSLNIRKNNQRRTLLLQQNSVENSQNQKMGSPSNEKVIQQQQNENQNLNQNIERNKNDNLDTQKIVKMYEEDYIPDQQVKQNELYDQFESKDLQFKSYRTNYNFFQTKVSDAEQDESENEQNNNSSSNNNNQNDESDTVIKNSQKSSESIEQKQENMV